MDVLKVAANSNPNSVAGALAGTFKENGTAELQTIGAGAINQVGRELDYNLPVQADLEFFNLAGRLIMLD